VGLYLAMSAFLLARAGERPEFSFLAFVATIPLFLVISHFRANRVLLLGGFWGFCYCLALLTTCGPSFTSPGYLLALLTITSGVYALLVRIVVSRVGYNPILLGFTWAILDVSVRGLAHGCGSLPTTPELGSMLTAVAGFGGYALVAFLFGAVNAIVLSLVCQINLSLVGYRYSFALPLGSFVLAACRAQFRVWHAIAPTSPRGPPGCCLALKPMML
jgi:hypothetical protein